MQINFERRKIQILLFTISKQQEYKYKTAEFQENPSKLCYLKIPRGRKRNAREKPKKKKNSQNGISSISSLKLQRKIIGKSLEKKTRAKKCVKKQRGVKNKS